MKHLRVLVRSAGAGSLGVFFWRYESIALPPASRIVAKSPSNEGTPIPCRHSAATRTTDNQLKPAITQPDQRLGRGDRLPRERNPALEDNNPRITPT